MSQSVPPEEPDALTDPVVAEARAESSTPASTVRVDDAIEADQDAASAAVASPSTPAPKGSLWRDRNFLTLWGGQTFAQFGAQITELALPVLAVLVLNANEFEIGVINAAGFAAFLVIGLPAGAWIDRMRKRHVMIAADLVRALALATVPLLWWAGVLDVWHLVVIALVMSVATVFFDVSYQSIVPSLVRPTQIAEANGKLESTHQLANIAGPGIAGWLVGILTAPIAVLATVFTYLASFVALAFTRDDEIVAPKHEHEPLLQSIREGVGWVFGNPYLRRIVGTTGVSNFFSTVTFTMLPIFLLRDLGLSPASMGIIFSLGAVGGLLGAMATPHIVRWIGEARSIPISAIAFSVAGLFLPVAALVPEFAFVLLVVQSAVSMFTVLLYNIVQVSFRQRITPKRLLGRMNASIRFFVWGVMPIAALLAGALGTWLGAVPTMWIGAIGGLVSALFVVTGPFWAMGELPDAPTDAEPTP
ncbi:MFS transporter [Microbacterium lacus]|uniref:MFS transporter n=1 Tax=Microbacterium lacus TaxID=415217 RepID=UPI00384DC312